MILRLLAASAAALLAAGCGADASPLQATVGATTSAPGVARPFPAISEPAAAGSLAPLQPSEGFSATSITLSAGAEEVEVPVLVADEPELRSRGLMFREEYPADAGMLFVFEAPTRGSFWMKNTLIPLSIAFIDGEGQVLDVQQMLPCVEDPCPRYGPDAEYRYALEVNRGFFAERGIGPGWTLDIDDVSGGDA